ncbi:hypothetical protein BD847_0160 [Flavobacterium cutihirudinis]|uniref:Uncharacterized protein n=1 Tax=Flavobacterium cutihirudinis TaxID=1265740 RepID=A0A3D9FZ74_9FLAO|nr:hypothetical protein [Flavobacterium cutihirudinis]RED26244.1 hypothetical protein BD847_0160 [Flavobacterium cutihirudinis]
MKRNYINSILKIFAVAILFFSCSSDLDFDQAKDLKLEPVIVANLAYFSVPANLLAQNTENQPLFDVRDFDVFKDKFFNDHLKRCDFDVEVENTIERNFIVTLRLLDANNTILETISYPVPAYKGSQNIVKYPTEVFQNLRLENLKRTVKIVFVVLIDGEPLTEQSLGNLKLRSSATVYLDIE